MRILYFGTLEWGCTSLQRADGLRNLAGAFYAVDTRRLLPEYTERGALTRLAVRLGSPRLARRYAELLVAETARFRPDCLWIDQGLLLGRTALAAARAAGARVLVHYTPDAIGAPGMGRTIHSALAAYDLCITTKRADVPSYRALGARRILFSYQGYDPAVHRPLPPPAAGAAEHRCDLVFVGQRMREREGFLLALAAALPEADLRIYGRGWETAGRGGLARAVRNRWLRGDDYALALSNARLGLCFLNTEVGDEYTTRTFEIPACGALMLAQRSPAHEELFRDGAEAVLFGDAGELVAAARRWLADESTRARVAAAGHRRVAAADCTWRGRMRECLEEVARVLSEPPPAA